MAASIEEMRQWGQDNGWDVPDEGRLPPGLRAAYDSRDRPRPAMHQPSVVIEEGVFAGLPPIEDDDDLIQERAP